MASTYLHPDDRPSDSGPLWDATPGVCCAAFQLGACSHTEGEDYDYDDDLTDAELAEIRTAEQSLASRIAAANEGADDPF